MDETKNIKAMLIMEVLGKPPEHLNEALEEIIKNIDAESGVRVVEKKINEPTLLKDQKDFYTNFAEIEVEVEEIFNLILLMFKYMPAHIEIIEPELIALTNDGWSTVVNEIVRRLHGYDEVARILQAEKGILEKKLKEAFGERVEKSGKKENKK